MAMAPGDLITLEDLKIYLGIEPTKTTSDELLKRMIRSASAFLINYCNRNVPFGWGPVTTVLDGNGKNYIVLRELPATDIISLDLGNGTILGPMNVSSGSPPSDGYVLPDDSSGQSILLLRGYCFPKGRSNIIVSYNSGYRELAEAWTVASSGSPGVPALTVQVMFAWLGDIGITLSDGVTALTKVTGAPAAMQYSVVDGVYTFNAAQGGVEVLISYQRCPDDVAQAVRELCGERYKYIARIGQISQSISGQVNTTTSFSQKDMNDFIKQLMRPYIKVVPA